MSLETPLDNELNLLIEAALKQQYCGKCPNKKRMKEYCSYGIYPRWGAGSINAPIMLILERPGDQPYLQEMGLELTELTRIVPQIRQLFTNIMFTSYPDGKRYLEALLEFVYGMKARRFEFSKRLKVLEKLVYITELIKCPGRLKGDLSVRNNCISNYFYREWSLISKRKIKPQLVIIATGAINEITKRRKPEDDPNWVNNSWKVMSSLKTEVVGVDDGTTYLKVYHPSYVNRNFKNLLKKVNPQDNEEIDVPCKHPDQKKAMRTKITWYLLAHLNQLVERDNLRKSILKEIS